MASQIAIIDFIDPNHPIKKLADQIPWHEVEESLAEYYAPKAPDHKPLRLMGALLMLKYLHDLDNDDIFDHWIANPYFQYFTGENTFQWDPPFEVEDVDILMEFVGTAFPKELMMIPLALLEAQTQEEEIANKLLNEVDPALQQAWQKEFEAEHQEGNNVIQFRYKDDLDDEFDDDDDTLGFNLDEDYDDDEDEDDF